MVVPSQHSTKPVGWAKAITCVIINQFATPGLGSIIGGRFVSGAGQLLFALAGFCLLVVWMVCYFYDRVREAVGQEPVENSFGWMGKWGLICFGAAWLWALVTSLSLLRQAKTAAQASKGRVPPRIAGPPPETPKKP